MNKIFLFLFWLGSVAAIAQTNPQYNTVRLIGSDSTTITTNGTIRYNPVSNKFRFRQNGAWVSLGAGASGSSTFEGLTDGPGTFSGNTLRFMRVNTGGTALEYRTAANVLSDIGAQAVDADLTTISGLTPSNDDFLQFKSSAWANRTLAQVRTDLALVAASISNGVTTSAPNQDQVFDALALKRDIANTASALTDGGSITITGTKHTLTTTQATITFSDSFTGDFTNIDVTFNTTAATWTFPSGSLCVVEGSASGDNTATVSAVSGDKIVISIWFVSSGNYRIAIKNFGQ